MDRLIGASGCNPDLEAPALVVNRCSEATSESASFTWSATDNCSSTSEIEYRYRLDSDYWSTEWGSATSKSYSSLSRGSHLFEVQARDAAGSESKVARCSFGGESPCPPPSGVTEFAGMVYELGPPPLAWISDVRHLSGVDISQCYKGLEDVEVYCTGSPCAGFVSPDLLVGDEVEVRGYVTDGGDGAWAEISIDGAGYYLRRTSAQTGKTYFRGTAILESGLVGAVNWTVRVDDVLDGVDISSLEQVVVSLVVNPTTCLGGIYGDIQPGDPVWVLGYFDGTAVSLCLNETYFLADSEPQ